MSVYPISAADLHAAQYADAFNNAGGTALRGQPAVAGPSLEEMITGRRAELPVTVIASSESSDIYATLRQNGETLAVIYKDVRMTALDSRTRRVRVGALLPA